MLAFFARKLLSPAAGILLAATAVISVGQAAFAGNVRDISVTASSQGSENLLLAQIGQPPQGITYPSPSPGTVSRVALPMRIPESSMTLGLGLVAGSLVVTRRKVRVKN